MQLFSSYYKLIHKPTSLLLHQPMIHHYHPYGKWHSVAVTLCSITAIQLPLPQNTKEFNDACSSFVAQAGCFKCPGCAKPYIAESWYQKHLSKYPEPTGAILGWTELPMVEPFTRGSRFQSPVTCVKLSTVAQETSGQYSNAYITDSNF